MIDGTDAIAGKGRKRPASKPANEPSGKKTKVTFHLSREADIRLNVHCTMMDCDRSTLIERLINENLRRYVVSDRGGQDLSGGETAA